MPLVLRIEKTPADDAGSWERLVAILMLAHFALCLGVGLSRHWGFLSSLNDLGVYDQAIWGSLHGRPFLNTTSAFNVPINWLGFHFNPVLVLFVPFYALAEAPEWLLLAQAAALSLAAWPLFLLAVRVTGSERAGGLWAIAYLANPFVLNAAVWDFHAVSLGVPFAALGLLAVESRNARLLAASCCFLLTVQEHMGVMVAGFGALWGLRHGGGRFALGLILLGLGYTWGVLGGIMPALSPSHTHPMLSEGLGSSSRYGWLGHSLGEIVSTPLRHPLDFAKTVFLDMEGGAYLAVLLLPFLYYPLAGWPFLLPGLADLAANLLSSNPMPRTPLSYHSVGLVPMFTVAALHGSRVLCRWQQRFRILELTGLAAAVSLTTGYLFAPLPLWGASDLWAPRHYPWRPDPDLAAIRALLPPTASLSVQGNIGPHFSQRAAVHLFPAHAQEDDAVLLHLDNPTRKAISSSPAVVGSLAHHLQMEPAAYLDAVENLLADPRHGVLMWKDPWLMLGRGGAAPDSATRAALSEKLSELRRVWRPAVGEGGEAGSGSR